MAVGRYSLEVNSLVLGVLNELGVYSFIETLRFVFSAVEATAVESKVVFYPYAGDA
jgi:hypothetical protein